MGIKVISQYSLSLAPWMKHGPACAWDMHLCVSAIQADADRGEFYEQRGENLQMEGHTQRGGCQEAGVWFR